MRKVIEPQMQLGELAIDVIKSVQNPAMISRSSCIVSNHRCPGFVQTRLPAIALLCGQPGSCKDGVPVIAYHPGIDQ